MTKVVIISVPYTEPWPMVAPALLSGCLNDQNISAVGIDFSIEFLNEFVDKSYWPELKNFLAVGVSPKSFPKIAAKEIFKFIRQKLLHIKKIHNPEYFGLSIFTNESINFSYILIPYIRKYLPTTKIMVGGKGIELTCGIENRKHYEKYFDHGMADICVVGDAESAIIDVVANNKMGINFAAQQTKEDLDNIPITNWKDYDFSLYKKFENVIINAHDPQLENNQRYISITGSKGCVRKCTFCDVASFWPKYIYRKGESIADEIINHYHQTKIDNFWFTDNLINGSISFYREMNEKLARTIPNKIKYHGYAIFRPKTQMPEEDFFVAKQAGCASWTVGVESGSEQIRNDMGKKFNNEDLDYGVVNLHKNNINQTLLLMVGYPTETEQDFLDTLEFLKRHAHLNKNGMIKIATLGTFMMLDNSPLIQNKDLFNKYKINYDLSQVHLSRFFWTAEINPENTFDVRYQRWFRLVNLVRELDYQFTPGVSLEKLGAELNNMKQLYNEYKPKKVFPVFAN